MRKLHTGFLFRTSPSDQGTEGILFIKNFQCYSLELPWRDNKSNISCVPADEYLCELILSPKFGWVYHLTDVKGRTYILTHSGNWAGDVSKGYHTHSHGCLLFGSARGTLKGQRAVLNSAYTVQKIISLMRPNKFLLRIMEVYQ